MSPSRSRSRPGQTLTLCVALFSVLPVPARWVPVADRKNAGAALRWLPVLGVALAAAAGGAAVGLHRAGPLVGAAVAVTLLAVLTRGLHLDGLADLADGLGSRRPTAEAQEVMRRSDIGPFGVAALVLVLLLDSACLASVLARTTRPQAMLLLMFVVGGSRASAVLVGGPELRPARPDGFGALVTGSQGAVARVSSLLIPVAAIGALGASVGFRAGQVVAVCLGIGAGAAVAYGLARHAARRLGGVSGDVYGACIEVACAVTLLICAAAL